MISKASVWVSILYLLGISGIGQQELEILEVVEVVQPTAANLAVEELNGAVVVHDIKNVSDIATQRFAKHNTS